MNFVEEKIYGFNFQSDLRFRRINFAPLSEFYQLKINREGKTFKGTGSCNVNKLLSKRLFCSILIGHITVIFCHFSQNECVIWKMDSCT